MPIASPLARVVVVGGYGMFGARVAERLARSGSVGLVLAGRSAQKARDAAAQLEASSGMPVEHAAIDAVAPDHDLLGRLGPRVIVNASGPFQTQSYGLARAAIAVGSHYVDLADARDFVVGIKSLDREARAAGVLVTSGASSVPALAAALIDAQLADFARLDSIEHGITPANGYDPGEATTASILGGVGKAMQIWKEGSWQLVHGWQGLERVAIPGLGHRLMTHCDVPDLSIFPERYGGVSTVVFKAGLDVGMFQLGLWVLAGAARAGLVRQPERFAPMLIAMKRRLRFLGGDAGGMIWRLGGEGKNEKPLRRTISLIVRDNKGPYVPAIASVVIARKLLAGELAARGAIPCTGLVTLADIESEAKDLPLEILINDSP